MDNRKTIKRPWIQQWFAANPLFFVVALPLCADLLLTVVGQGPAYWQNYHDVSEMGPVYMALEIHPLVYLLCVSLYACAVYQGTKRLKRPWNVVLACVVFAGHVYGSSTWVRSILLHLALSLFPLTTNATRAQSLFLWSGEVVYCLFIGLWAGLVFSVYLKQQK